MAPLPVSLLKDVKPYETTWKVHVKSIHLWKQSSNQAADSLQMILADETSSCCLIYTMFLYTWLTLTKLHYSNLQGTEIHATCMSIFAPRVRSQLTHGIWRSIQIFPVSSASGKYQVHNILFIK
ncbi:hypothetical protein Bca4012_044810 [Brassica carinata]